jgi:acetoin utilization protein AcuC
VLRAFRPEVLFTQCGVDTHRLDPLADLRLSVDGQRASQLALRALANELCNGRWIATGGGGYASSNAYRGRGRTCWPPSPAKRSTRPPTPTDWRILAQDKVPGRDVPLRMTDDADPSYPPWQPAGTAGSDLVDRAIMATRTSVFPLHGLDPYDPRD